VTEKKNFYERAGIKSQAEFYGALYASDELLHPDYFHAVERFHIRWARTMWIFNNVAAGSTLLDLGSGSGLLGLLKRKGVRLAAVDLSSACAMATRRNGYDLACAADLRELPFQNGCFDYVVSLDVMGHIEFEAKDAVLAEISRVLKPDGVTMHGVEIMNTDRRKNYDQMNEEELKRFVQIDGHVGMEPKNDAINRFARFFRYVQAESRFSICQSAEELIKQADEYGVPLCEEDLLDYLRNLSHDERRAFNMAMGYVFQQISDQRIQMPGSEYLFLRASNSASASLYNEHVDSTALQARAIRAGRPTVVDMNQSTNVTFDGGWYPAENFPPIGRWMGRRAKLSFCTQPFVKLSFKIVTHIPDVGLHPLKTEFLLNGRLARSLTIADNEPRLIEVDWHEWDATKIEGEVYELEIKADRTWQPKPDRLVHRDDREISVAVSDIKLVR